MYRAELCKLCKPWIRLELEWFIRIWLKGLCTGDLPCRGYKFPGNAICVPREQNTPDIKTSSQMKVEQEAKQCRLCIWSIKEFLASLSPPPSQPPNQSDCLNSTVILKCNVAEPGRLTRKPDPDFYLSRIRIRDLASGNKWGGDNFFHFTFFVATNITKFKIILFLNWQRKVETIYR